MIRPALQAVNMGFQVLAAFDRLPLPAAVVVNDEIARQA
jgi:hypothetical protein